MDLSLDHLDIGAPRIEDASAGVLVPVIERPDGAVLVYTERADHLSAHAGEMSFPGGGRHETDESLQHTALREADEEIDLDPDDAEVVGRLPDIWGPTGDIVRPYVARVPDISYEPNPAEVTDIVRLPVASLIDRANYSAEPIPGREDLEVTLPYFRVSDVTVWGLTGYVTGRLLQETAGWDPPPGEPLEHPGAQE